MSTEKETWMFFQRHIYQHVTGKFNELYSFNPQQIDVKRLYQLIHEHRLDLIFLPRLKPSDFKMAPDYLQINMRCIRKIQHLWNMKKCLLELALMLEKEHITFVVLKGILLNSQLYGTSNLRLSNDIDLLIHEKDLLTAHSSLLKAGFDLKFELLPEQLINTTYLMQTIKDLTYTHPSWNFRIELHWQTSDMSTLCMQPLLHNHIVSHALSAEKSVHILDNENNFLYLCIHGAVHNWQRLPWVIDIAIFSQRIPLDWTRLMLLAQQYNAVRPLLEATMLLQHEFNILLPDIPHTTRDVACAIFRLQHARKLWRHHRLKTYTDTFYRSFLCASFNGKMQHLVGLLLKGSMGLQELVYDPGCSKRKLIVIVLFKKCRSWANGCVQFLKQRCYP